MGGDLSIGEMFAQVFQHAADLAFRVVPGTIIALQSTASDQVSGPITAGLSPIEEPVTTASIVSYLEQTASAQQYQSLVHGWSVYVAVAMAVSLLLATLAIYCFIRIRQLRHFERLRFEAAGQTVVAKDIPRTHLRWNRVREQIQSDSEQNWRLAILEADIMLSELLDMLGYRGDTIADKLKNADRRTFNSLDAAWEAHKIRNRVAHEGASLHLPQSEARRVIQLYERVFREFQIIQ